MRYRSCSERIVRFLLLRKTCTIFTFVELAFSCIIAITIAALIHSVELAQLQIKENEALKGYDVFEPYANCAYEKTTPFNHVSCALTIDGFAVRRMKPEPFSPDHCVDRIDLVRCHASKTVYELNKPLAERKVDECPGYSNGILNEFSPAERILAAAVENSVAMNRTLHVSQLIIKCPKCWAISKTERVSHFTAGTMECVKDVETTELGWPTKAALCISSLRTVVKLGQKCD